MKIWRKPFMRIMAPCLLALLGIAFIACNNDESKYDPEKDPEKIVEPVNENDQVKVKYDGTQTLYYYSSWATGESSIAENMSLRFDKKLPYAAEAKLTTGDVFFFKNTELEIIKSEPEMLAALKDMYSKQGVILMMEGGTEKDFSKLCDIFACFNPYEGQSEEELLNTELPLWILSGQLPSARGFYAKLTAKEIISEKATTEYNGSVIEFVNDDIAGFASEYHQGVSCDMATQSIKNCLKEPLKSANGSNDLTNLTDAYIVTAQAKHTLKFPTFTDKKREATNNYQIECHIWNAYSYDQNKDYYLIEESAILNVTNSFLGEWHCDYTIISKQVAKSYGWCITDLYMGFYPLGEESNGTIIHDHAPLTTELSGSSTSSVGLDLAGKIGAGGIEVSGGVSITNSITMNITDVKVVDRVEPGKNSPKLLWEFQLREPEASFSAFSWASCKIVPGASAGISVFSPKSTFVISVPTESKSIIWQMYAAPQLKLFYFSDIFGIYEKNWFTDQRGMVADTKIILPSGGK